MGNSKKNPQLGYMVDSAFNSGSYSYMFQRGTTNKAQQITAVHDTITSRYVECPQCEKQVELRDSPNPKRPGLYECSICGLWYRSKIWHQLQRRREDRITFRKNIEDMLSRKYDKTYQQVPDTSNNGKEQKEEG